MPKKISRELNRRSFSDLQRGLIKTHAWRELARLSIGKSRLHNNLGQLKDALSIDSVYKSLDKYVAKELRYYSELRGIYAYEDGAFNTFKEAEKIGIRKIYELPIGYWNSAQTIYRQEAEINPDWASTLSGLKDRQEKLNQKRYELELASSVIVASEFVKNTILENGFRNKKIYVLPYGMPRPIETKNINRTSKLKVLFVGSLSQRKGISYLFESTYKLKNLVELTIVGRMIDKYCDPLNRALENCKWIETLSHNEILNLMSKSDVLVFPSLFEGFGLVITEALSQGLPVITTHHTGGPDIISHGKNGFIVSIRDSLSIMEYLERLALDRDLLQEMSINAITSASKHPWEKYRQRFQEAIKDEIGIN